MGMLLGGQLACGADQQLQASVQLEPCTVRGAGRLAECTSVQVPRDRSSTGDKSLTLRVVVLRATGASPVADPLFMLAGGPGQAASEAWPPMMKLLSPLARSRDVVFVDQRGTGSSAPLDCESDDDISELFREGSLEHVAKGCAESIDIDPSHYGTTAAADDIDEVRRALGYERINLLGSSYGTRLALRYAQRHPEHLRSMVLDAVAPSSLRLPLPLAEDAQRSLDIVFDRCAKDDSCRAAFPTLREDFATVLDTLGDGIDIQLVHPRRGTPLTARLSRRVFAQQLRGVLYSPELQALVPLMIERAKLGDYQAFIAQVLSLSEGMSEQMSVGLLLTILCTEDVARISDEDVAAATRNTFVGTAIMDDFVRACALWPRGPVPPTIEQPVVSDAPTLLLSGELDPVTPPRWADAAAKHLTTARHLVVPGMSHGVTIRGCMPHLISDFIDAPASVQQLDADCITDEAPPFFVDFAGPHP